MTLAQKTSTTAVTVASIAAVIQGVDTLRWLFITLILVSLALSGVGILIVQRDRRKLELLAAMEEAFGEKPNRVQL